MQRNHKLLSCVLAAISKSIRVRIQAQKRAMQIGIDTYRSFQTSMCRGWNEGDIHSSWRAARWETSPASMPSSSSSITNLCTRSSYSDRSETIIDQEELGVLRDNDIHRLLSGESNHSLNYSMSSRDSDKDVDANERVLASSTQDERKFSESLRHLFSASTDSVFDDEAPDALLGTRSGCNLMRRSSTAGTGIPGHSALGFRDVIAIGDAEIAPCTPAMASVTIGEEQGIVTAEWSCRQVARIAQGTHHVCSCCKTRLPRLNLIPARMRTDEQQHQKCE